MNPKAKYQRLAHRLLSSSVDYGRQTIYLFQKYCKRCGEGLQKLAPGNIHLKKTLWRKSFCSEECLEEGARKFHTFPITVKPNHPNNKKESVIEEMAFLAVEMKREEEQEAPISKLIRETFGFKFLSEKLRFLEVMTGELWMPSRYYFWLNKLKIYE